LNKPNNNSNNNNNNKRPRGRNSGGRRPQHSGNRSYDSNGPEVKVRGSATQICDKYLALARDASSAGDRVRAESLLQHAEHYFRLINGGDDARNNPNQNSRRNHEPASVAVSGEMMPDEVAEKPQPNNQQRQQRPSRRNRADAAAAEEASTDQASGGKTVLTEAAGEADNKPADEAVVIDPTVSAPDEAEVIVETPAEVVAAEEVVATDQGDEEQSSEVA